MPIYLLLNLLSHFDLLFRFTTKMNQFKMKEGNIKKRKIEIADDSSIKRRKIEIADDSSISSVSIEDIFNVRYPDICANILARLDARSLVNCRIVSEEWRNVIDKDYNI